MRRGWAVGLFFFCAAALSQPNSNEPRALAALDHCIARLDPEADIGFARIAARCPQLAPRLEQSALSAWLPRGWKEARNDLSIGSLAELRALAPRELELSAERPAPNVAHLKYVLAGLGPEAQGRGTLWMRFRSWLREVLARSESQDRGSWLDRMVRRQGRSQTLIDLLTYSALALVLILAVAIVTNEMRAIGWPRRRPRVLTGAVQSDPRRKPPLSWRDVERAAPADKPGLLLELIVAKLAEQRRVAAPSTLTVRELTRAVELPQVRDRERLLDLALMAERVRYSAAAPTSEAIGAALERGKALLENLNPAGHLRESRGGVGHIGRQA